jgi:enolase
MDVDMLIEFYNKLINDHPMIEYIEDPLASSHVEGYKKFILRMRKERPAVKVGVG